MSNQSEHSKRIQNSYTGASTTVIASVDLARNGLEYGPQAALLLNGARALRQRQKTARSRIFGGAFVGLAAAATAFLAFPNDADAAGIPSANCDAGSATSGTMPCTVTPGLAMDGIYMAPSGNVHLYLQGNVTHNGIYVNAKGTSYDINVNEHGVSQPYSVTVNPLGNAPYTGNAVRLISGSGNVSFDNTGNGSSNGLTGSINGYNAGVYAKTLGNVTIHTAGNVHGGTGPGIYAYSGNNVSIVTEHDVGGNNAGIDVHDNGGNVSVTTHGDVSATNGDGINVSSAGGNVTVFADRGVIYSPDDAIHSVKTGSGNNLIINEDQLGSSGNHVGDHGIYARNIGGSSNTGNVTVYSTGNIYSTNDAINARTYGLGNVTVGTSGNRVTGNIHSYGNSHWDYGIIARIENANSTAKVSVYTGEGNITSYGDGIAAENFGHGDVVVNTNGTNIKSLDGDGIFAVNGSFGGGNVTVIADPGVIYAAGDAIHAYSGLGGGNVLVRNEDQLGSTGNHIGDHGIFARASYGSSGNVTVYSTGNIYSYNDGINARGNGTGNVIVGTSGNRITGTIHAYGNNSWSGDYGIIARISDANSSGFVSVYTGNGTITSDHADGIYARNDGNGSVTVNTSGTNINAPHGDGIRAVNTNGNSTGDVTVVADPGIIYSGYDAIHATTAGNGNVIVSNEDQLGSTGNHIGDHGIFARSYNTLGTGDVTVYSTGNIYSYNDGINARTFGLGDVTVGTSGNRVTGTIHAYGNNSWSGDYGIIARISNANSSGFVSVYTGNGTITSDYADGILARNDGKGSVTVNTSGTNVTAPHGDGIRAVQTNGNSTGNVTVIADPGIIYSGLDGIHATTAGYGNIYVNNEDTITGPGNYAGHHGILARSYNTHGAGSVSIYNSGNIYSTWSGIEGRTYGNGSVNVGSSLNRVTGNIVSRDANGIDAEVRAYYAASTGGVSVFTGLGTIYAGNDAIHATVNDNGGVLVSNEAQLGNGVHGNIAAALIGDHGIFARSYNTLGTGDVTVYSTGNIYSYNDGINARTLGLGDVTVGTSGNRVTGTIHAYGNNSWAGDYGIIARISNANSSGFVSVYTGNGTITSDHADGIYARNDGKGSVTVNTSETNVNAFHGDGIRAVNTNGNSTGDVTVVADPGVIYSGYDAIHATTAGNGSVIVHNSDQLGSNWYSWWDSSGFGPTGEHGIFARSYQTTGTGDVTVYSNGNIYAWNDGINALTNGYGNVSVGTSGNRITGHIASYGESGWAYGITARITNANSTGTVSIYTGNGTVYADDAPAISAWNEGKGDVIINTLGTQIYGDDVPAIASDAEQGNATITLGNGTYAGTGGGYSTPIVTLYTAVGHHTTLTLEDTAQIGSFYSWYGTSQLAIQGRGGDVDIYNHGTIIGRVDFSGLGNGSSVYFENDSSHSWHTSGNSTFSNGNDVLYNAPTGLIATNGYTKFDFLSGTDRIYNDGTIVIGEGNGTGADLVLTKSGNSTGTLTFYNGGAIVLGSPTVPGNTTTDGNPGEYYTGSRLIAPDVAFVSYGASSLFLDAELEDETQTSCLNGAVEADCIVVGAVSGTGTAVHVTDSAAGEPGALNLTGVLVVDAASTPTGTVADRGLFHLSMGDPGVIDVNAGGPSELAIHKGFFDYHLLLDAAHSDWYLVGLPGQGAMELTKLEAGLQNIWHETADGWNERTADLRHDFSSNSGPIPAQNGSLQGWSLWGKGYYGNINRSARDSITDYGTTLTFNTNYTQELDGFQVGADYTMRGDNDDAWVFGVFGGYVTSEMRFKAGNDRAGITAGVVAGYASYMNGPWFVDALIKDDIERVKLNFPSVPDAGALNANSIGGMLSGGYHYEDEDSKIVIEPLATIAYVNTTLDGFDVPGSDFSFDNGTSLRGRLAVRASKDFLDDNDTTWQPFGLLGVVEEFKGDNLLTISSSSGDSIALRDHPSRTFGEAQFGVNVFGTSGWSGFARGEFMGAGHQTGEAVKVGIRYSFGAPPAPPPPPPPAPPPPPPPPPVVKTFIVFFDFDKSNLTDQAQAVVTEAVKAAKEGNFVKIKVTGHTDTVGSESYNQALSERRAQSVKDEMVKQGMDGSGITTEGKSFHDPLVPTGPGVREPQNRRAVIDLGE